MKVWPLKFRPLDDTRILFADDTGGHFMSDSTFLDRYARGKLTASDAKFLKNNGHAYEHDDALAQSAFAWRWAARQSVQDELAYLILVPTLRCNLACTYCQVSRAPQTAKGFDWSEETLTETLAFIDALKTSSIKIEFQGGEPLLRTDILEKVRAFCRERFDHAQFVVCTNLQSLDDEQMAFLDSEDTFISTSLDGPLGHHDHFRTQNTELAAKFFQNLELALKRFGTARVSALPTIDIDNPPNLNELIDTYESYGFNSIYLRPVNHQGFARRRHPSASNLQKWNTIYGQFLDLLIDRNFERGSSLEEYYFSYCLNRFLHAGADSHVDLRNPNMFAKDYLLVDFDGQLYPTDEARMLSRIGQIDLSIGSVTQGVDRNRVAQLDSAATNNFDPDCIHCPYQAACGSDPIDNISRYGRVDMPRADTWFCGRQLAVFDRVTRLVYSRNEKDLYSLQKWAGVSHWPRQLAPVHYDPSTP